MSLSNEQLLYLSALAYYNVDTVDVSNKNVKNIINGVRKGEKTTCFDGAAGYSDKELGMDKIIAFIENDSELMKLQMVYPNSDDETTSSVCFVNTETLEVYVVYCGNYIDSPYEYKDENGNINSNSTWISNMKGAVECDTVEQKLAVEFYNNAISAARNVLNNVDGDIDITVCGHSTGGNQAQYVTIAYEKSQGENYSQNNDVDRCVSFDGQGFSNEFITKYYNDIQKRSNKITSYEPTLSYVGSLLNSIPGAKRKYIHLGNTEAFGIGIHMPAEMLDENGGFKKEEEYTSAISRILNNISKEAVAITDGIPGIDVDNACEKIGQFITEITGGDIDEEAIGDSIKNLLTSKDVIALLIAGTVTTGYEISSGELTVGKDAFIKNIEAYRNTLVNATELFKSGEYVEALLESYYGFSRNMFNDNIIQSILQHADVISYVAVPLGKQICKLYEKFDKSIGISLIKKFKWKSIKHLFGWLDKSYRQASASVRYISDPLVIDLDGDGFELTDVENGVYFDNDNYGLSEKTQWVLSDDGLLAIDLNGDGIINDGSELFGSSTAMPDGSIARLGFEALAQYDENGDGIIDEKDSAYYRLLVWQDNNRNGISEANELKTLKELGIESISLKAEEIDGVNTAYIKYFDGRKRKIGEFSFDSESYNTIEKESERISEDIEKMPDVNAIGNVASLHTLMQKDTTGRLAEYVNLFAKSDNDNEKSEIITKILYFITGADNISGGSRGGNIDAKKLRVIEMFMGRNFIGTEGSNPVNTAADILNGLYNNIHELYYNLLNAETKLKDYMEMVFIENDDYINTEIFDTYMSICISEGIDVKGIIKDMGRYIAVMNDNQINLVNYIQKYIEYPEIITELKNVIPSNLIVGSTESDTINISNNSNVTVIAGAGDDIINANDGNDLVYAGSGNDTVNGGDGDDTIYGGAGDDILNGEGENDKLYGGVGNDTLNGGYGDDTYYFELGDGEDTIYEDGEYVNVDRIVFGKGISPENISLERIGNDLVIKYSEVDKVTVKNAYGYKKYCGYGYYFVEKIEFSDGTVWNKDKLIELISIKTGTAGNDVLTGYEGTDVYNRNETFYAGAGDDIINANDGNDLVYAGSGNDTVNGGDGDDTIYGGAGDDILNGEGENDKLYGGVGNDTLNGGYGDDTYYFELGDGEDTIYEDGEYVNVDRIVFGKGISPENISLERIGNDLVIKYSEVDKVTVKNAYGYKKYCGYGYYFVEKIEFSDGTVWNKDKLIELISIKTGTAGNDVLTGYEGTDVYNRNETFYAGAGDDIINANDGNDLVYAGSGNDTVNGGDGDDTIYGGAGDDILNGEGENDKLYGGVGNDTLNGGYGDDTYYFELGDGEDTIYEDGEYVNVDRIVFGKGISPENISLERIGNDLVIKYSEVDKVTVKNAYGYKKYCGYGYYFVEKIEFSDGTVWNKDKLIELISIKTGTAGNDVLTGYEGTDVYNINETFYGGAGNDTIYGGDGNDTYIFGRGDGIDTIVDNSGSNILSFEENISIEDLMMTKNGNNLEVSISDTTDKIILNDYFINSSYQNFNAEFADGSSLSQNDFSSIINGTYVYESALKQSELLVQSMASTSDDGNVSEMVNITTQDNNMTDTQLFVSNQ